MPDESCPCTRENHMSCAGRVPIFSSLNEEELQQVASLVVQKKYDKNTLIYPMGSIPKNMIIISKGKIKVYVYSQDGKEQIMYILTDKDFFGARHLIHDKAIDFNLRAVEDTVVCLIEKQNFQKLLLMYPGIGLKIMEGLCERLEKMENMFKKISPKEVDSRVNMLLLELIQKYGIKQKDGILIELPISREEMASYIGVARETVCRKLTSLKDEGIIDLIGKKKLLVIKEESLVNMK